MIVLSILKVLLWLPIKLLNLLPSNDFNLDTLPDFTIITTALQTVYYFFPKSFLMPLVTIIVGRALFNAVKNFIEYVKSWIPTM